MDNKKILVAMNLQAGLGPKTMARLLHHWPQLSDLLKELKHSFLEKKLPPALIMALKQLNFSQAELELNWAAQKNCHILSIGDQDYPQILAQISDPPLVLYLQGKLDVFKGQALAIVGSRQPSLYGIEIACDWARRLALQGLTLVSGLALGIDTLVHRMAVEAEKPTIAVLGSGLKQIYPLRNKGLAAEIQAKGAIISEFPLFLPPNPGHFPRRNRIISGLSLCTLVVEAAEKSGTMITAAAAIEQNRDLFVLPGRVDSPLAMGGHRLIQQGARLAANIDDILVEYSSRL
jgi:DNA processing protein